MSTLTYSHDVEALKHRYEQAKEAEVGSLIFCAMCGTPIRKTTYHKAFCSNQKTGGRHNCKDRYWNTVDPERYERTKTYRKKN